MEIVNPSNRESVLVFEKELDFSLPTDYKEFLSKYDGVFFRNYEFYVKDLAQNVMMDLLYGVSGEKWLNIRKENEHFEGELPDGALVIGEDPGGAPILLINSDEIKGVYFFDSNHFFEQSSDDENTFWIADTFTDFLYAMKKMV